jgi:peptide/nickel transport system permease protein
MRPGRLGLASTPRRRPSLLLIAAGLVVLITLVLAVFGEVLAPMNPNLPDLRIGVSPPIPGHPLGTDALGRDVLSRMIVGARTALIGPILVAVGAMVLGSAIGVVAGYMGGRIDGAVMRWAEFMFALPALLVVLVVVGIIGGGYVTAIVLYIVLIAPFDARIVRGATLEQKPRAYVEGARGLGLSRRQIMLGHIWPNVAPIEFANAFLTIAWAITAFAALSYLGLGVDPGTPDWGRMLADGRRLLGENPLAALAPGIALVMLAASIDLLGNASFDWFTKRRGR